MDMNITLMSTTDMVGLTSISQNIDPNLIAPFIKNAEIMYMLPVLSVSLYEDMLNDVATGATKYKTLLEDYVYFALSYYALYNALPFIHMRIQKVGVVKAHSDNSENIDTAELSILIKRIESIAVSYTNLMREYLDNNANLYPLYRSDTTTNDLSRKAGHSIFLGFNTNNGKSY